jgi:uncharacterized protein YgbK (DUF1537 family)
MPVLRLEAGRLLSEPEAVVAEALAFAHERIARGPVLIASSAEPEAVRALQSRHGSEAAGHAVEAALSAIAEGLVAAGVRRLVIAGGETSGACVDRLGLRAFLVGPEIAAGVPVLRSAGRPEPMLLALKSGNFGGPDFFARALDMMQ